MTNLPAMFLPRSKGFDFTPLAEPAVWIYLRGEDMAWSKDDIVSLYNRK